METNSQLTRKDKKKIAAKAFQERKKKAKEVIAKYLDTNPPIPADVREAIAYYCGLGEKKPRNSVTSELRKMLLTGEPVSSMEIFSKFEYGRPTMEKKIREFIKTQNPDERIWVSYIDGNYLLQGTGATPPEDWTGYLPENKDEL